MNTSLLHSNVVCGAQALDDINKWNCKLQVPEASIPAYQAADQWKEFFFIEPTNDIIMGDANNDRQVNVTDIVATVNYIMNKPSTDFNFDAADVNQDGYVNVTDIVAMVNIIMKDGTQNVREVMNVLRRSGFIF